MLNSWSTKHRTRSGVSEPAQPLARNLILLGTLGLCLGVLGRSATAGDGGGATNGDEKHRIERAFDKARERYRGDSSNAEAAWQFGRACFDWADFATNNAQRAAIAEQGLAACQKAIDLQPKSAPAHYYMGLNLGQLAQTESVSALGHVKQMEAQLKAAFELDPRFDYAGPDRSLGLLYRDAPGWPVSVGSSSKARQHLTHAIELAPTYPDNHICLLEALLKWGDRKAAQAEMKATEPVMRDARSQLTGPAWAAAWRDWDERFGKAKSRIEQSDGKFHSPRDQ